MTKADKLAKAKAFIQEQDNLQDLPYSDIPYFEQFSNEILDILEDVQRENKDRLMRLMEDYGTKSIAKLLRLMEEEIKSYEDEAAFH